MLDKLDILIINQYYPPDTSATAAVFMEMAHVLARHGHHVSVLAGRPSYDPLSRAGWRPLTRVREGDVVVERVGSLAADRRSMVARVGNYASFVALAAPRAVARRRPNVVVVGSDPPIAVGVGLLGARGRPVVYSLQDLHPDAAVGAGLARPSRAVTAWDALHRRAMQRCSRIVTLDVTMAERIQAKGVPAESVVVIPNGAKQPVAEPDPAVVAELRQGSRFVVIHAGNLGMAGPWDSLLEASRELPGDCRLVFVGDGIEAERLRRAGASVIPYRPRDQVPSVMAAGDLQVVATRSGMGGSVVPSKLYPILAHGRPVLGVVPDDSEVARILRHHGCGIVVGPDSPHAIAEAIRRASASLRETQRMGERARDASLNYDKETLLERFVSLVESVASYERHRPSAP